MEVFLQLRLQVPLDHCLGDAVRDSGDLKRSDFPIVFRYFHPTVWLGLISACYEIVPDRFQNIWSHLRLRYPQNFGVRCPVHPDFPWLYGTLPQGFASSSHARRAPRSDASYPTSPFDKCVVAAPADHRVPLSSHSCLTLTNAIPTGPGPSLRARFAARPSSVLRRDPPP